MEGGLLVEQAACSCCTTHHIIFELHCHRK
jgi:hypothetical protein